MLIADAIGIVVGVVLGRRIPERIVKWCAASIFIIFGVWGLYDGLPKDLWTLPAIVLGGRPDPGAAWLLDCPREYCRGKKG